MYIIIYFLKSDQVISYSKYQSLFYQLILSLKYQWIFLSSLKMFIFFGTILWVLWGLSFEKEIVEIDLWPGPFLLYVVSLFDNGLVCSTRLLKDSLDSLKHSF